MQEARVLGVLGVWRAALAVRLVSFGDAERLQCAAALSLRRTRTRASAKVRADFVRAMHTCLSGAKSHERPRPCSFGYSDGPDESAAGVPDDPRSIVHHLRVDKERNWKPGRADTGVRRGWRSRASSDLMRFKKRAEDEARRRAAVEKNSRKLEEQLRDALTRGRNLRPRHRLCSRYHSEEEQSRRLREPLSGAKRGWQTRAAVRVVPATESGEKRRGCRRGSGSRHDSRTPGDSTAARTPRAAARTLTARREEDDDEGRRSAVPAAPLPSRSVSMPVSSSEYLSLGSSKTRLLNGTYAMDQSSILLSSDVSSSDSDSDAGNGSESVGIKGLMPRRDGKLPKNATHLGGSVAQHHLVHKRSSSEPLPQGNEKKQKKKVTAPAESSDDDLPF